MIVPTGRYALLLLLCLVLAGPGVAEENENAAPEREGNALVSWRSPVSALSVAGVRLLGINDLHGELETRVDPNAPGGAAVLAAYLAGERDENPKRTLLLVAGDSIGASALLSGALRDEPTMAVLNALTAGDCPLLTRDWPMRPSPVVTRCRIVSTVGNHEFDRGVPELERLLYGGRHPDGPVLGHDWAGTKVPFLAANVVRRDGQAPFLPAAAIVDLAGIRIGVIGAVTAETPMLVPAPGIGAIQFLPEAGPINAAIASLRAQGVHAIVLLIHEGLAGPTNPQPAPLRLSETRGRLAEVLAGIDGGIDVVVAGHTHRVNNLLLPLRDGSLALVVQARSYGTAYSEIDLEIDTRTGAVIAKSATVLPTWSRVGPGATPDRAIAKIVAKAKRATAAIGSRQVGMAAAAIRRADSAQPEWPLGNFVADAQRSAAATELAFMNTGGLRNDLEAGPVTFGELYGIQPFGNTLMKATLTGEQVLRLLEQQWSGIHAAVPRYLAVAGLRYVFDLSRPVGQRIVAAEDSEGLPIDTRRRYTIAANDFLLGGGDGYAVFAEAIDAQPVMKDIQALEAYVTGAPDAVRPMLDGRARRRDAAAR